MKRYDNSIYPTFKVVVHEAFHAVLMMLDVGLNIPLVDLTEEVYAYLIGWVGECIDNFLNETSNGQDKRQIQEDI